MMSNYEPEVKIKTRFFLLFFGSLLSLYYRNFLRGRNLEAEGPVHQNLWKNT